MQDLLSQLDEAKYLLKHALENYLAASYAIRKFYQQTSSASIPLELSNRITIEFSSLASSETDLGRIKSIIGQARNHSFAVVPIHSLPLEILGRIFSLIVSSRPCGVKENSGEIITFPKYPDFLAQVCSRWRQITLNQPDLWSHVDIVPYHCLSAGFRARAEAVATRVDLLDVHCYEPCYHHDFDDLPTLQLLSSIGPQIRSLELVIPTTAEDFGMDDILTRCLVESVPGVFNKLVITNTGSDAPVFWEARDDDTDDTDDSNDEDDLPLSHRWMYLSPNTLEEVLRPVTILRLDGAYFQWNHVAYHGLSELCLIASRDPDTSITESELVNIFMRSPRLQALHFGLTIKTKLPGDPVVVPTRLPYLKALKLTSRDHMGVSPIFRLLAPFQTPLDICLDFSSGILEVYDTSAIRFLEQSNITKLHVIISHEDSMPSYLTRSLSLLEELIRPLHQLRDLALENFYLHNEDDFMSDSDAGLSSPICHLDTLYIIKSTAHLALLQRIIQMYPSKMFTLWDTYARGGDSLVSGEQLEMVLSETGQPVKVSEEGPNPIEHWNWN